MNNYYDDDFVFDKNLYIKPDNTRKNEMIDDKKINKLILSDEVKDFINIMHNNYTLNNLSALYNNISSLRIKLLIKPSFLVGKYDVEKNLIKIKPNYSEMIYHELMHMASSYVQGNYYYSGFHLCSINDNNRFISLGNALNEGFTELYTKINFDSYESGAYPFYVGVSRAIREIIGKDKCDDLYFNADLKGFIDELLKYTTFNDIALLIRNLDRLNIIETYGIKNAVKIYGKNIKDYHEYSKDIINTIIDIKLSKMDVNHEYNEIEYKKLKALKL